MIQNRLEHTANKNHDEWTWQRERRTNGGSEEASERNAKHILKWSRS